MYKCTLFSTDQWGVSKNVNKWNTKQKAQLHTRLNWLGSWFSQNWWGVWKCGNNKCMNGLWQFSQLCYSTDFFLQCISVNTSTNSNVQQQQLPSMPGLGSQFFTLAQYLLAGTQAMCFVFCSGCDNTHANQWTHAGWAILRGHPKPLGHFALTGKEIVINLWLTRYQWHNYLEINKYQEQTADRLWCTFSDWWSTKPLSNDSNNNRPLEFPGNSQKVNSRRWEGQGSPQRNPLGSPPGRKQRKFFGNRSGKSLGSPPGSKQQKVRKVLWEVQQQKVRKVPGNFPWNSPGKSPRK